LNKLMSLLVLFTLPVACSSGSLQVGRDLGSTLEAGAGEGGSASACATAGGKCVLGNVTCADNAPSSAQDCNPGDNPGGSYCCLSTAETDSGSSGTDSGAASTCQSAGGKCVLGNVTCADEAPAAVDDCNPHDNPGGAFCCLSSGADSGAASTCQSAGGKCVLGNVKCAKESPAIDDDCNPHDNPGGAFCCLTP
jgi:hypothetical protein